jgi:putative colanic acid biosynthesis glycosyltransferase
VVNHGFETDKRKLMSALNGMDALVLAPAWITTR